MNKRIQNVTSKTNRKYLMGIAIIMVILHHWGYYSQHLWDVGFLWGFCDSGYIGVDIFLFLSVIGLCYSYEKRSLWSFYFRRFQRLYPCTLAFYLFTLPFFYPESTFMENFHTFVTHSTGLTMFWKDTIEWYVPALTIIYVSFPLLYIAAKYISKCLYLELTVLFLLVVIGGIGDKWMYFTFPPRFAIVFLSLLTYFHKKQDDRMLLLFAMSFLFATMLWNRITIYSTAIPFVLIGVSKYIHRFPLYGSISWLGKYTLEIYLAQNIAIRHFFRAYYVGNEYVMYLLSLLIIVVMSFVLHWIHVGFWKVVAKS